jgi:hypothetical protein
LRDAVLEDEEVGGFEAGDELMGLVEDDVDVQVDDGYVDPEGIDLVIGIFYLGRGRGDRSRRGRLFFLLLFDDDGTGVGLGTGGVIGRRGRRWRLLLGLLLLLGRLREHDGGNGTEAEEDKKNRDCKTSSLERDHHLPMYSVSWTMELLVRQQLLTA